MYLSRLEGAKPQRMSDTKRVCWPKDSRQRMMSLRPTRNISRGLKTKRQRMILLNECVGKKKSHQSTVSPRRDKARLVGADSKLFDKGVSWNGDECFSTPVCGSCPNDLFFPHLSLVTPFLPSLRGELGKFVPSFLPRLSLSLAFCVALVLV